MLKFKTNVCFFKDRDLTKKRLFCSLSTQCKNKKCELFQKLKMKSLRRNKKSEAVFEKCFSSLFYAQYFDDQNTIKKKSCEVYKKKKFQQHLKNSYLFFSPPKSISSGKIVYETIFRYFALSFFSFF